LKSETKPHPRKKILHALLTKLLENWMRGKNHEVQVVAPGNICKSVKISILLEDLSESFNTYEEN
jgi:hypothetical protein